MVPLGINTVELKSEGFKFHVKVSDKVKKGDKLMDMGGFFMPIRS